MTEERLALGRWGEEEAARFLCRLGMKIVERNLRTPVGEIDLIARHGRLLVFVEVKTRRSDAFIMLLTAGACLGLGNIALGFGLGLALAWCLKLRAFRLEEPGQGG